MDMIRRASRVIEAVADNSWMEWGSMLMPTFVEKARAAQEALARREREEQGLRDREEQERHAEADRLREEAQSLERERVRRQREVDLALLSPTASRAASRKTSRSSMVEEDQLEDESTRWPMPNTETHQNPNFSASEYVGAKLVSWSAISFTSSLILIVSRLLGLVHVARRTIGTFGATSSTG
jgi:hypothetical protein